MNYVKRFFYKKFNRKFNRYKFERAITLGLLHGQIINLRRSLYAFFINLIASSILSTILITALAYRSISAWEVVVTKETLDKVDYIAIVADASFFNDKDSLTAIAELIDEISLNSYFKRFLIIAVDIELNLLSNKIFSEKTLFVSEDDILTLTIRELTFDPHTICKQIYDVTQSSRIIITGNKRYSQAIHMMCNLQGMNFILANSKVIHSTSISVGEFIFYLVMSLFEPIFL